MRLRLLALLFAGTAAFCQSPAPQKIDPNKLFQMPDKFTPATPQLGKLKPHPFLWNKSILAHPAILAPRPSSPQIDPKIIVRPPWRSESKGQDVAHRVYPNLKLLPLRRGPQIPR